MNVYSSTVSSPTLGWYSDYFERKSWVKGDGVCLFYFKVVIFMVST